MFNYNTTYQISKHELNELNETDDLDGDIEGGVLFLHIDKSFHSFNSTACMMWKVICKQMYYKDTVKDIAALFNCGLTKELETDIQEFFKYLISIKAIKLDD